MSRVHQDLSGVSSIPGLFAWAFNKASKGLAGKDLAQLQSTEPRQLAALGWVPTERLSAVASFMEALADRDLHSRYRWAKPQRRWLLESLAPDGNLDPRLAFVLAVVIDSAFQSFVDDVSLPSSGVSRRVPDLHKAAPVPPAFYGRSPNPPPPIGHMTSVAICQRWMQRFRVVPALEKLEGFGAFPKPALRRLPARTRDRLSDVLESRPLVIAGATWRRHRASSGLKLEVENGLFRVRGYKEPPALELMESLLQEAHKATAHILLLPELALSAEELPDLQALLKRRGAPFPCLVVTGLAHRQRDDEGAWVNEAVVLDQRGEVLLRHEKLEPFSFRAPNSGQTYMEDILPRESEEYAYLDTPMGRLVVNVCRDIRSDVPMFLNRALGASLILVPAYSKRLDFAAEEGRMLGARQTAILVAVNPLEDADGGKGTLRDAVLAVRPIRGQVEETLQMVSQAEVQEATGAPLTMVLFTFSQDDAQGRIPGHRVAVPT